MNFINTTVFNQNINTLSNWMNSTPVSEMINSVTYDVYESNNPFRKKFDKTDINNRGLRTAANTTTAVGAEIFSAFANPYYLPHKFMQIPVLYSSVIDTYKNIVSNKKEA